MTARSIICVVSLFFAVACGKESLPEEITEDTPSEKAIEPNAQDVATVRRHINDALPDWFTLKELKKVTQDLNRVAFEGIAVIEANAPLFEAEAEDNTSEKYPKNALIETRWTATPPVPGGTSVPTKRFEILFDPPLDSFGAPSQDSVTKTGAPAPTPKQTEPAPEDFRPSLPQAQAARIKAQQEYLKSVEKRENSK